MGFQFLLSASPLLRPLPASIPGTWAWSVSPVLQPGPWGLLGPAPRAAAPLPSQLALRAEPDFPLAPRAGSLSPHWPYEGTVVAWWLPSLLPGPRGPTCSLRTSVCPPSGAWGLGPAGPSSPGAGCLAERKGGLVVGPSRTIIWKMGL